MRRTRSRLAPREAWAVVLAAGEGKRMRPLTASRPKVMLPVAGKPILEHLVEQCVASGFVDLIRSKSSIVTPTRDP